MFFSIFAVIFGGSRDTTRRVPVIVVDEDDSGPSHLLSQGLEREGSLAVKRRTEPAKGGKANVEARYTAATAETAVREGRVPVAIVIPRGFGENPVTFGPADPNRPGIQLLVDPSDVVAPQMVAGLLQKVAMTSMPAVLARQGARYLDQWAGGLTAEQRARVDQGIERLGSTQDSGGSALSTDNGGVVAVTTRAVVGGGRNGDMIAFYAAAIGVMFLLFTASGSAGALLEEAESGTIDRVLSSHVTMTSLLLGKLFFNSLLALAQLWLMFLWAWAVFKLDLWSHLAGFVVMGAFTAVAVAAFGMLMASICKTRQQLGALSTLVILIMSSIGGSMFPRFLMPEAMQRAGLFTINAWAIDGFTKVFWRGEPLSHLWPQLAVLAGMAVVLFAIARRIARRWEFA